jgi:hypothetical protein
MERVNYMFEQQFYDRLRHNAINYHAFASIILCLISFAAVTFIIPGFPEFNYIFFCIVCVFCLFVANIYVGVLKGNYVYVFLSAFLSTGIGFAGRLLLEWNEVSIALFQQHKWSFVIYPLSVALIVTILAFVIIKYSKKSM